jgi:hypothetical protein
VSMTYDVAGNGHGRHCLACHRLTCNSANEIPMCVLMTGRVTFARPDLRLALVGRPRAPLRRHLTPLHHTRQGALKLLEAVAAPRADPHHSCEGFHHVRRRQNLLVGLDKTGCQLVYSDVM